MVSDLTPGLDGAASKVQPDYVLGVNPSASSLAQLTVRRPVPRALDLGTGCGVQALHLAGHVEQVVATDVNPRALWMTGLNAALNDVALDVRRGSLFDPVRDERFDLIVTNPPFVISPATGDPLSYRDSGLPGDEVVRRLVTQAPRRLRSGGWCQVLANWAHVEGQPWEERVARWLGDESCDAWVVQRETVDPAQYVELWLKDAGVHGAVDYRARYDAWLAWFEDQRIVGVGFGWVNLRRHEQAVARDPVRRLESWPFPVEQPLGAEVVAWARGTDLLTLGDEALLELRLVTRADVREETLGTPGAADPVTIVLRQQHRMRRARQADTVEAALVGACDGELTVGQIADALATLLDRDAPQLRSQCSSAARELIADGYLESPR